MRKILYSKVDYFVTTVKNQKEGYWDTMELVTDSTETESDLKRVISFKLELPKSKMISIVKVVDSIELGTQDRIYSGFKTPFE